MIILTISVEDLLFLYFLLLASKFLKNGQNSGNILHQNSWFFFDHKKRKILKSNFLSDFKN